MFFADLSKNAAATTLKVPRFETKLNLIVRKFFRRRDDDEIDMLRRQPDDMNQMLEPMPLKADLTDQHYSQLFFVVGHVSIKMLTYIE